MFRIVHSLIAAMILWVPTVFAQGTVFASPAPEVIAQATNVINLERAASIYSDVNYQSSSNSKPERLYLWERFDSEGKQLTDSYVFAPAERDGTKQINERDGVVRKMNNRVSIDPETKKLSVTLSPEQVKNISKPAPIAATVEVDGLSKQIARRDQVHQTVFDLSTRLQAWEAKKEQMMKNMGPAYSGGPQKFQLTQIQNTIEGLEQSLNKAMIDLGAANKRVKLAGGQPRAANFARMITGAGKTRVPKNPFRTGFDIGELSAEDPIPQYRPPGSIGAVR